MVKKLNSQPCSSANNCIKLHKINEWLLVNFILHNHLISISNQMVPPTNFFESCTSQVENTNSKKELIVGDRVLFYMDTLQHYGDF